MKNEPCSPSERALRKSKPLEVAGSVGGCAQVGVDAGGRVSQSDSIASARLSIASRGIGAPKAFAEWTVQPCPWLAFLGSPGPAGTPVGGTGAGSGAPPMTSSPATGSRKPNSSRLAKGSVDNVEALEATGHSFLALGRGRAVLSASAPRHIRGLRRRLATRLAALRRGGGHAELRGGAPASDAAATFGA
jgi:hypothetical protein